MTTVTTVVMDRHGGRLDWIARARVDEEPEKGRNLGQSRPLLGPRNISAQTVTSQVNH